MRGWCFVGGLQDGDLAEGVEIRVIDEPAADVAEKPLKAKRLFLGEREYVLYPHNTEVSF